MRLVLGALCAAFLMLAGVGAEAQETPVRAAAARLDAALAGDATLRAALLAEHVIEPRQEEWRALLELAAEASGGFEIVAAEPGETERFGEFVIRTREGARFAWLVLGVSRREPDRISTLFVIPTSDPAGMRRLPETRLPARDVEPTIRARVDALARADQFSGAVLVARNGRIVRERYAGFADRDAGLRVGRDTAFNIASMGKMFTAIAVARLVEEGRMSWDDPVSRWIPDYPEAAGRDVTIAQLLAHTSGLGDIFTAAYYAAPQSFLTSSSYMPLIAQPPAATPGERFSYSNAGYSLLGIIIERASREDFFANVQRVVFDRARMGGAGYPRLDEPNTRRALGYRWTENDPFGLRARQTNEAAIALRGNAAGGAYATARDMFAFARAWQANRLVSQDTRAHLEAPLNAISPTDRYGSGFITRTCAGRDFVGHGGGGSRAGVNSNLWMSADGEWVIVTLSNYDPTPRDFANELCDFIARQ